MVALHYLKNRNNNVMILDNLLPNFQILFCKVINNISISEAENPLSGKSNFVCGNYLPENMWRNLLHQRRSHVTN